MKKTCIFYGNCQVMIHIHRILTQIPAFAHEYQSYAYVNHDRLNTITLKKIKMEHLVNCDLFIYQPLGENHGVYATEYLKKFLKSNCQTVSFPYVYNSALYTVYWEKNSPRWRISTLVNCGWRDIMFRIKKSSSLDDILTAYDRRELDFYFDTRFEICLKSLQEKEKNCDLHVSNFIIDHHRYQRLFITQNHLTNYFYRWIASRILTFLKKDYQVNTQYRLESNIEAECLFDSYNQSHFQFSYCLPKNDQITKNKIKVFYEYFHPIQDQVLLEEIVPYYITTKEPEKFTDHDL